MKISVILATFNRKELLARTLGALRIQDFRGDWELIVSDDGSSDGTGALIKSFSATFPVPIRYLQGINGGPARARNRAIRECSSDWVLMTDDDCLPASDWVSAVVSAIHDNPDAVGIEGSIVCPDRDPLQHWVENLGGKQFWTANMAFRRDILQLTNGFDESFPYPCNEDADLAMRVRRFGEIVFCSDALVNHPPLPQLFRNAGSKFVAALESEWVFYRRNPQGYRDFKPLRHPRVTVWYLFFWQPVSKFRHHWRYFVARPDRLAKYLARATLERLHAIRNWRRWA